MKMNSKYNILKRILVSFLSFTIFVSFSTEVYAQTSSLASFQNISEYSNNEDSSIAFDTSDNDSIINAEYDLSASNESSFTEENSSNIYDKNPSLNDESDSVTSDENSSIDEDSSVTIDSNDSELIDDDSVSGEEDDSFIYEEDSFISEEVLLEVADDTPIIGSVDSAQDEGYFHINNNTYYSSSSKKVSKDLNVISLWGPKSTYTIHDKTLSKNIKKSVATAIKSETNIVVTGGTSRGRLDFKAKDGTQYIVYNYSSKEEFEYLYNLFHDKTISVMGDSISTLEFNIPGRNMVWNLYSEIPYNNMYWGDIITRFGAKQGTIEAWSGSTIGSSSMPMYSWSRVKSLGKKETPDVIFFYGGSNIDSEHEKFNKDATSSKIVVDNGNYKSTAAGYAAALNRIRMLYPNALIITLVPYYDQAIEQEKTVREISAYYNIATVDLYKLRKRSAISPHNSIHPDKKGHLQISNYICEQLFLNPDAIIKEISPENRTITFDATTNGGQCEVSSKAVTAITEPIVATKRISLFKGWYTRPTGGTKVTDFNKVGFSTTLYAQFVPCEHFHMEKRNIKAATFTEAGYTGDLYCYDCEEKLITGTVIELFSSTIEKCVGTPITNDLLPEGWKWDTSTDNVYFPENGKSIELKAIFETVDQDQNVVPTAESTITLTGKSHSFEKFDLENHQCSECGKMAVHDYTEALCSVCNQENCKLTNNHSFDAEGICTTCEFKCSHIIHDKSSDTDIWAVENGVCSICHAKFAIPVDNMNSPIIGDIPDQLWVTGIIDQDFNGSKIIQPEMKVYWKYTLLENKKDYTVTYKNNTNAGTASVTITGKGNYSGIIKKTFIINPIDISASKAFDEDITIYENGKKQKPTTKFSIDINGKSVTLKKDVDYKYAYPEIIESGDYVVTINGIGNYCSSKTINVHVIKESVPVTALSISKIDNQKYTGFKIEPELNISYNKTPLVKGTDYLVEYHNQLEVGTATATIQGLGNYSGKKTISYKITGTPISKASVENLTNYIYSNDLAEEILKKDDYHLYIAATKTTPAVELSLNEHYTISYENYTKAGTATVVFTGINGYTGTLKKNFKISKVSLTDESRISVDPVTPVEYQKNGSKPALTVKDGDTVLIKGVDYSVKYSNNKALNDLSKTKNSPTATIIGKGNYTGTYKPVYFQIVQSTLDNTTITATDVVAQNKANICKPTIKLIDANGSALKAGIDYSKSIEYTYKYYTSGVKRVSKKSAIDIDCLAGKKVNSLDIIPAGTVIEAKITGKGAYTGTKTVTFNFIGYNISKANVVIPNMVYTQKEITLDESNIQVTRKTKKGNETLVLGEDFIITGYKNNVNKGTAKVILQGIGSFGGTKEVSFKIVAKNMNYKVSFNKNDSSATGKMTPTSLPYGTKLPANTYKLSGKKFKCWCTKPTEDAPFAQTYNNKEAFVRKGLSILSFGDEVTLYAIWE